MERIFYHKAWLYLLLILLAGDCPAETPEHHKLQSETGTDWTSRGRVNCPTWPALSIVEFDVLTKQGGVVQQEHGVLHALWVFEQDEGERFLSAGLPVPEDRVQHSHWSRS